MKSNMNYLTGFGNHFESEAISGALPQGRISPQHPPFGLYVEQLSGTAFTAPKKNNLRSWLYRILPSVKHGPFEQIAQGLLSSPELTNKEVSNFPPTQFRWDPIPYPEKPTDFIEGLITFATNGSIPLQLGAAVHLYAINRSMNGRYFYNSDGDFLIVPQEGDLILHTEFGTLTLTPGEIAVVPRGIKYQVQLSQSQARGYICENFAAHFTLPERGPIGANGLANDRDFQIPEASFEEQQGDFELICKFRGGLWQAKIQHSPLDVIAWHGNYTPYKYNLKHFNTINTVSFDHPDPSIFTVLTAPSETPGTANVDFVIFPERWMVADETFRPPYYHRNVMSEFMGLISGGYDAKQEGFAPGGCSLHNCMAAHGPDADSYEKASKANLKPQFYRNTLAFMFESRYVWQPTKFALDATFKQNNYLACWDGLKSNFKS